MFAMEVVEGLSISSVECAIDGYAGFWSCREITSYDGEWESFDYKFYYL